MTFYQSSEFDLINLSVVKLRIYRETRYTGAAGGDFVYMYCRLRSDTASDPVWEKMKTQNKQNNFDLNRKCI